MISIDSRRDRVGGAEDRGDSASGTGGAHTVEEFTRISVAFFPC